MTRRLRHSLATLGLAAVALSSLPMPTAKGQVLDLLVSDVGSNTIKRFSGSTGSLVGVFAQGGGLNTPFGLAFGPDKNLYVSSLGTGDVLEYNGTTGAFIGKFIARGNGGLVYPNQLSFGSDGNLYVPSYSAGGHGEVLEYGGPSAGANKGVLLKTYSDPNLQGPTGLVFDPNNLNQFYVSSSRNGEIFRFDNTGTGTDGVAYIVDNHLHATAGLAIGTDGNLYASNFNGASSDIIQFDPTTGAYKSTFATGINGPVVPVFGNDLRMYVSSYGDNAVYRYNAFTGAFVDTFVSGSSGNLSLPTYMTFFPPNGGAGVNAVPEPASLALLLLGGLGLHAYARSRSRRRASASARVRTVVGVR